MGKKEYRVTMVLRERKVTSAKMVPVASEGSPDLKALTETRARRENRDSPDKTE